LTAVDLGAILTAMKAIRMLRSRDRPTCCCGEAEAPVARRYPETEEAARLFRALSDETRLVILKQLRAEGEVCACDFQACCVVAQPTVSHHLKVLREAGLVTAEKHGLEVRYRLNPAMLERVRALLP